MQNGEHSAIHRPSLSYLLSLRSLFCLFWVAVLHRFYCNSLHINLQHILYITGPRREKTWHWCMQTTKVQTFWKLYWLHFLYPNFKVLASLCSWADWFEPYMTANPEDRFSRIELDSQWDTSAQMSFFKYSWVAIQCCLISGLGINLYVHPYFVRTLGRQAHWLRLVLAFDGRVCNKYKILPSWIKW